MKKSNPYLYMLTRTKEYLEQLPIHEHNNALWDILHDAIWHRGVDWVSWIDNNKHLVEQVIVYDYFVHCPEELKDQVRKSIHVIKSLNR